MKWLLLAAASIVSAQPIVITAGTLIDGKGRVGRNQQIVIEGSKITAIHGLNTRANYDLTGFTVMQFTRTLIWRAVLSCRAPW